jgi:thioesterase domain-containing protein
VDIIPEQQGIGGLARALVERPVPHAAIALTPTHLGLLDSLVPEGATTPAPGLVLVAGEALDGRLARRWQQRWPGAIMLNKYGPTEATVLCTAYRIPADQPDGPVPIGRPIDGVLLFVLDAALEPVPVGAIGELYIGGPCVGRGYRRDPGRTAERFVNGPRGRLYRTGDLGYWRADGELVFVGRVDHQVKIRGQRIEPGEIEVALGQHPAVAQCVIGPWRDAHDEQRLVAWIVLGAGAVLDAAALREYLGAQLPARLVPSYFVAVERIPLTAAGKIDRGSLPAPVAVASPAVHPGEAPGEDLERERRMLSIWSRILGDPALTVDDRFIDRGGDSLLAVRLAAEIGRELGVSVDAGDVYRYPSVRLMARALAGGRNAAADAGLTLMLRPGVAQPPLFLFHPIGGHVLCYGGLCRALGGERPVIGVRARGSEPGESPLADIAAMARLYLGDVQAIQPHGPYLLAGWSMGGLIAFEVARLLRAQGEPVALLAMIDSKLAGAGEIDAAAAGPGAWAHVLATLTSIPPERIDVPADVPVRPDGRALADLWQRLAGTGAAALLPTAADFERFVGMFHAHAEAMRSYVPGPLPGPDDVGHAVFFAPRHEAGRRHGQLEGWRALLPALQIVEVPGDHFTVVRADAAVVASRLARAIDVALAQPGTSRIRERRDG